jgi:uncharacterized protein YneF (UPF0154 family)
MSFVFIVTLIIIGMVAAADYIEGKLPQSKATLNYLKPHEQWIGLVSIVLGLFLLIGVIFTLGTRLRQDTIYTLVFIASLLLLIVLGFLMTQNHIKQYLIKNEKSRKFNQDMLNKFSPMKQKLGQAAIVVAFVDLLLLIT